MRRHVTGLALLALLALPMASGMAGTIKEDMCYSTELPRSYGPVRSMTAEITSNSADNPGKTLSVKFTEWDVANTTFDVTAACQDGDHGSVHCSIDCDGGRAELTMAPDGRLALYTTGIATGATGMGSRLQNTMDADGGLLTGFFVLRETPADQCQAKGDSYAVALQPGDDTPEVAGMEKRLNDLGFLLEKPDDVYSDRTSDAVRQFQAAMGLPVTGIIDGKTAQRLIAEAAWGGGC